MKLNGKHIIKTVRIKRGPAAFFFGPLSLAFQAFIILGDSTMTMYQRKRIKAVKDEIERQHAAVDSGADRLLEKLKASKWTAAILLGVVVLALIFFWSLS